MKGIVFSYAVVCTALLGFSASAQVKKDDKVRLITLDPGHFHAALVQKTMLSGIEPDVYVYSPKGEEVQQHLDKINAYNHRAADPTHWNEIIYMGNDFLY